MIYMCTASVSSFVQSRRPSLRCCSALCSPGAPRYAVAAPCAVQAPLATLLQRLVQFRRPLLRCCSALCSPGAPRYAVAAPCEVQAPLRLVIIE